MTAHIRYLMTIFWIPTTSILPIVTAYYTRLPSTHFLLVILINTNVVFFSHASADTFCAHIVFIDQRPQIIHIQNSPRHCLVSHYLSPVDNLTATISTLRKSFRKQGINFAIHGPCYYCFVFLCIHCTYLCFLVSPLAAFWANSLCSVFKLITRIISLMRSLGTLFLTITGFSSLKCSSTFWWFPSKFQWILQLELSCQHVKVPKPCARLILFF